MKKIKPDYKWLSKITIFAFVASIALNMVTSIVVNDLYIGIAFIVLILVILMGIFFDVIGLAVATAVETPFHARATKRINGSKESIILIRNADKVSSFCNDVIGDIAGVISGGLAASIIVKIQTQLPASAGVALNLILTALVSAFTIGGKACCKNIAMSKSFFIVEKCGYIVYKFKTLFRFTEREK